MARRPRLFGADAVQRSMFKRFKVATRPKSRSGSNNFQPFKTFQSFQLLKILEAE